MLVQNQATNMHNLRQSVRSLTTHAALPVSLCFIAPHSVSNIIRPKALAIVFL
jgi:hypothetical protein